MGYEERVQLALGDAVAFRKHLEDAGEAQAKPRIAKQSGVEGVNYVELKFPGREVYRYWRAALYIACADSKRGYRLYKRLFRIGNGYTEEEALQRAIEYRKQLEKEHNVVYKLNGPCEGRRGTRREEEGDVKIF